MATLGSLTSLQAAAALSLFNGQGFNVNSAFNSNVIAYSTTGLSNIGGYTATVVTTGNANLGNIYSIGRYGSYYSGNLQTLGANTIPAITQTIPGNITSFSGPASGNVVYQIDQATARVTGSNTSFVLGYFLSTFLATEGYVLLSNKYLNAIDVSGNTNFSSYGVSNYQGLVTQGWDKHQSGSALVSAFNNVGVMTDSLSTGKFGTAGAVAQVLIHRGLGNTGNLLANLTAANVNTNDLLNPYYDSAITSVLSKITDPAVLTTVQETIESSIPRMSSLLDYTSISACAGYSNDSQFATMADVGADLYKKSVAPTFNSGKDVATLIQQIKNPNDPSIESLAGNGSLLSTTITNQLRTFLPINPQQTTITMLDVIGTPSGYYNSALGNVITGLTLLNATPYGSQITNALGNIVSTVNDANMASNIFIPGPPYYGSVSAATAAYESLLANIANDPSVYNIVNQINTNYMTVCQHLATEYTNWNKANFITGNFSDSMTIMSFAQSLSQYGKDFQQTGANVLLSGMSTSDINGSTIKAVLIEGQNYQTLQSSGISPNGYVAS